MITIPMALLSGLAAVAPAAAAGVSAYPSSILLQGEKATQTVVVSAGDRDVTGDCTFRISDASVASVSKQGVLTAAADGRATLEVQCKEGRASVPVTVTSAGEKPQLSFVKDVVPIFTMGGCAGSNCHGSIRGQAGFKLSLFGYEPDLDYQAIRPRIDAANPEASLLLQKPTFQTPHGGGLRFTVGSL